MDKGRRCPCLAGLVIATGEGCDDDALPSLPHPTPPPEACHALTNTSLLLCGTAAGSKRQAALALASTRVLTTGARLAKTQSAAQAPQGCRVDTEAPRPPEVKWT